MYSLLLRTFFSCTVVDSIVSKACISGARTTPGVPALVQGSPNLVVNSRKRSKVHRPVACDQANVVSMAFCVCFARFISYSLFFVLVYSRSFFFPFVLDFISLDLIFAKAAFILSRTWVGSTTNPTVVNKARTCYYWQCLTRVDYPAPRLSYPFIFYIVAFLHREHAPRCRKSSSFLEMGRNVGTRLLLPRPSTSSLKQPAHCTCPL